MIDKVAHAPIALIALAFKAFSNVGPILSRRQQIFSQIHGMNESAATAAVLVGDCKDGELNRKYRWKPTAFHLLLDASCRDVHALGGAKQVPFAVAQHEEITGSIAGTGPAFWPVNIFK